MDARSPFAAERIRVRGLVQGVGFRPHVWRLARDLSLVGTVRNDSDGVLITVAGEREVIDLFRAKLRGEAPKLARIDAVEACPWHPDAFPSDFSIIASADGIMATAIVPDAATCPECLAESRDFGAVRRDYRPIGRDKHLVSRDKTTRRSGYPFTNCTNCGPRLTIVTSVPYDRATTSMARFAMCEACAAEYASPADRRFHAQPIACPDCGPHCWVENADGTPHPTDNPIEHSAARLKAGEIVAIKGLGGFHLSCDATNAEAVDRLRARKRRDAKPLAVMVRDLDMAKSLAAVSGQEAEALMSTAAPIVLLTPNGHLLPDSVAMGQPTIGIMLAYTPLHHLLLDAFGGPLVMTSGNASEEPQAIDNQDARDRLCGIADAFLMHNRDIVNRVDDSVGRVERGAFRLIRRARGYAPAPLPYPPGFPQDRTILAMGSELKNTFALTTPAGIVLSPHCGDLDHPLAASAYHRMIALFEQLFDAEPDAIAVDGHPDYLPTQTGLSKAAALDVPVTTTDHHHAHIASVLGENGVPFDAPPVVGLALDGLGLGPDGGLWGGELLVADYRTATRVAGLPAVALPGGERAAKEPWRNLVAHLHAAGLDPQESGADAPSVKTLVRMIDKGLNAPRASSAGRLFDAFAALLGLHANRVDFEGQAAMALEALASGALTERTKHQATTKSPYPIALQTYGESANSDSQPSGHFGLWQAALRDRASGTAPAVMAWRFHAGLADALVTATVTLAKNRGLKTVALSGGVFLNRLLSAMVEAKLQRAGLQVLSHQAVPCNDGGLSLGQALIALARSK